MRLGKTLSIILLIAHDKVLEGESGLRNPTGEMLAMLRRVKNTVTLPHREGRRRFLKLSVQEQHAYDVAKQNAIEYLEDVLASSKP